MTTYRLLKLARYRGRKGVSLGTLFGILTLVLYFSYKAGFSHTQFNWEYFNTQSVGLKEEMTQLENDNAALKAKVQILEQKLQIQIVAKKNLADHLKNLHAQNVDLSRDLALYQSISGRPVVGQGLQVKAFQAFASAAPDTYRYLLILSKQAAPHKYAQGVVKMAIAGKIGDRTIELRVKYVDPLRTDGLGFKFKHLQELTGDLSFPKGFVPERVLLEVVPDQDWPALHETVPWVTDR